MKMSVVLLMACCISVKMYAQAGRKAPHKVWTNDDFSSSTTPANKPVSAGEQSDDLRKQKEALDALASETPRQLADEIVGDVQFPGRDAWQQKLYSSMQEFVAAGRKYFDVVSSTGKRPEGYTETRWRQAQWAYSDLKEEGISKAANWKRETRK